MDSDRLESVINAAKVHYEVELYETNEQVADVIAKDVEQLETEVMKASKLHPYATDFYITAFINGVDMYWDETTRLSTLVKRLIPAAEVEVDKRLREMALEEVDWDNYID